MFGFECEERNWRKGKRLEEVELSLKGRFGSCCWYCRRRRRLNFVFDCQGSEDWSQESEWNSGEKEENEGERERKY